MQFKLLLAAALAGVVSAQDASGSASAAAPVASATGGDVLAFTMPEGGYPAFTAGKSVTVTYSKGPNPSGNVKIFLLYGDPKNLQKVQSEPVCSGPNTGTCTFTVPKDVSDTVALSIGQGPNGDEGLNYTPEVKVNGGSASFSASAGSLTSAPAATGSGSATATGTDTAEPSATGSGSASNTLETVTGSAEPSNSASGSASATNTEAVATESSGSQTASASASASSKGAAVANIKFSSAALCGGLFAAFLAL